VSEVFTLGKKSQGTGSMQLCNQQRYYYFSAFYANENLFMMMMMMMNGSIWLKVVSTGRILYTPYRSFEFYEIRSVSLQEERLLTSQEGIGYIPNASLRELPLCQHDGGN
jgi:hypothetical protein